MANFFEKIKENPRVRDTAHNFFIEKNEPHILILRQDKQHARYNDLFLKWVRQNYPKIFKRIRLERVSNQLPGLSKTALLVPWLQDPVKETSPETYAKAMLWQAECNQRSIPVINPVEILSNSIKSIALPLIAKAGIRTAKVIPVTSSETFDPLAAGLSFPFFIRDDYVHSSPVHFVKSAEDLHRVPWCDFQHPIAVEYIDVQSSDGYYRKYRYVLMGERSAPRHLIVSRDWYVHAGSRVHEKEAFEEERQFVYAESNPFQPLLNKARKLLKFDFVAFDYSLDRLGNLVVWEPNPLPVFWGEYPPDFIPMQQSVINRLYREMLFFYVETAGLNDLLEGQRIKQSQKELCAALILS